MQEQDRVRTAAGDVVLKQNVNTARLILQAGAGPSGGALIVSADSSDNPKLGFFGTAPILKPTATPANASDLATAITFVNDLKAKLLALGLAA